MAQLGRAGRLGRSGCTFKSCHLDMAKYDEGDDVRLVRKYSFHTTHLKPNTIGTIKKIQKAGFRHKKYTIRWRGVNFDIIMEGDKDFVPLSEGM